MGFSFSSAWDKITSHPVESLAAVVALPALAGGSAVGAVGGGGVTGTTGTSGPGGTAVSMGSVTALAAPGAAAYEQYQAGETAKEIAEKNAAAIALETEERIRAMKEENRRTESLARARAAASGLSGASTELYINALIETGRADIDWYRKTGQAQQDVALSEGEMAYHQARAAMWGTIGSIFSGGMGSVASMF